VNREPPLPLPAPEEEPGLARWALPVAGIGLLVLFVSTLPALLAHRRLEAAARRLEGENRRIESGIERASRDRLALEVDDVVLEKAIQDLLAPGRDPRAPSGR
jgi:hypothetical protein